MCKEMPLESFGETRKELMSVKMLRLVFNPSAESLEVADEVEAPAQKIPTVRVVLFPTWENSDRAHISNEVLFESSY